MIKNARVKRWLDSRESYCTRLYRFFSSCCSSEREQKRELANALEYEFMEVERVWSQDKTGECLNSEQREEIQREIDQLRK